MYLKFLFFLSRYLLVIMTTVTMCTVGLRMKLLKGLNEHNKSAGEERWTRRYMKV